jgi:hypothetical protein
MASVIAIAVVALVLGGGVLVALGVVARQIYREDHQYSLAEDAPSVMARTARRLNGFGGRDLQLQALSSGRRVAA